jgi:hypothetical protein
VPPAKTRDSTALCGSAICGSRQAAEVPSVIMPARGRGSVAASSQRPMASAPAAVRQRRPVSGRRARRAVAACARLQHRDGPPQQGEAVARRRGRRQVRKARRSRRRRCLWHQAFLADVLRVRSPRRGFHPPAGRRCRPAGPDRVREADLGCVVRLLLPTQSLGTAGAGWGSTIMAGRRRTGSLGRRSRACRRGWPGRRRWSRRGPGRGTPSAGCVGESGRRRRTRA